MSELNETTAKRVAKLFRLLASDFDGEVLNAARRMKQQLVAEGLSINDIATVIESANGEIEERKYSDADAKLIFERGIEKGRAEQTRAQMAPPEFFDSDGEPRWYEMAVYCQEHRTQLRSEWEQNFANDMPARIIKYGKPTDNMIPHLLGIFVKLGGRCDPEIVRRYRR
jgi:hypothetical protein